MFIYNQYNFSLLFPKYILKNWYKATDIILKKFSRDIYNLSWKGCRKHIVPWPVHFQIFHFDDTEKESPYNKKFHRYIINSILGSTLA